MHQIQRVTGIQPNLTQCHHITVDCGVWCESSKRGPIAARIVLTFASTILILYHVYICLFMMYHTISYCPAAPKLPVIAPKSLAQSSAQPSRIPQKHIDITSCTLTALACHFCGRQTSCLYNHDSNYLPFLIQSLCHS